MRRLCATGLGVVLLVALVPPALLFPGRDVAMLPSGTVQGVLAGRGAARGEGVLAVGDPVYDDAADSVVASLRGASVQLARLPATAAEAKAVGDVVLLRGAATEGAVREALASGTRWRAVHFACHGVPDETRPLFSALALTPSAGDDGFVTALEAFRLRVDAAS